MERNKNDQKTTREIFEKYQELRKKHEEINNQPDGYNNCSRDACAFGLSFDEETHLKNRGACEKHAPILEEQFKKEREFRKRMNKLK